MEKSTALQNVNPKEFGIEESKAQELTGNLPQIQSERAVLEKQYDEVLKMDIENPETSKVAKEIRIKIRDNRTKGIAIWHKTTKEVFLRASQYIDAIKRREEAINERMEENLEQIEDYFENKEKERKLKLKEVRLYELEQFKDFVPFGIDLAEIEELDYQKVLNGAKMQFEAKQEAERLEAERLELERIENEKRIAEEKKLEAERIEAQRIENERLKAENEKAKQEAERIEKERQAELKRLADIQSKEKAEQERLLQIERDKLAQKEAELKAKQEAELKAKQEAELKAEKERLEAEKLAKAPLKKQMDVWINSFELPKTDLKNDVTDEIKEKFNSFVKWSKSQVERV